MGRPFSGTFRGATPACSNSSDDVNDSSLDFDVTPGPSPRNNSNVDVTKSTSVAGGDGLLAVESSAAGVVNKLTVTPGVADGSYVVHDAGAPLSEGGSCVSEKVDQATCSEIVGAAIRLGPGSATLTSASPLSVYVLGGDGKDRLSTGAANDTLVGDAGNDTLVAGPGEDDLIGAENADLLDGGTGPDTLDGGPGTGTASWATRVGGITADIDGVADDKSAADGPAGARDNVLLSVENLTGGNRVDTLTGNTGANTFDGGRGADLIYGGGGSGVEISYAKRTIAVTVTLDGINDDGNADDGSGDTLLGIKNLIGGSENDTLVGNSLVNRLTGGKGQDEITGGPGNDTILVRDGQSETPNCGGGTNDTIQPDAAGDTFKIFSANACERLI